MHQFPALQRVLLAIGCVSALPSAAMSAGKGPQELALASTSQALTFCQSGSMGTYNIDYTNDSKGIVQFGPGYSCVQKQATKANTKNVADALVIGQSGSVSECVLATPMAATKLCNAGGLGTYDIAYIKGGRYNTIGGQGYGCGIAKHIGGIGDAVCSK